MESFLADRHCTLSGSGRTRRAKPGPGCAAEEHEPRNQAPLDEEETNFWMGAPAVALGEDYVQLAFEH